MQESYREGPASHPDPESCGSGRKASAEALTGAHAGQPSSCESRSSGGTALLCEAEGNTGDGVTGEPLPDPAQSETLSMEAGPEGLYDLTRANHHVAQRIPPELERAILSVRRRLQAH